MARILRVAQQFLDRAWEARKYLIGEIAKHPEMKVKEIVVFGSLARGRPMPWSDIDFMLLVDGDLKDVDRVTDWIICDLSENFEMIAPRVDAHACRLERYYNNEDDGTIFAGFIDAVRKDGITIWHLQ